MSPALLGGLAVAGLACAALPAALTFANLRAFQRAPRPPAPGSRFRDQNRGPAL